MLRPYRIVSKTSMTHNTFLIVISPIEGTIPYTITSSFYYIYGEDKKSKRPYTPVFNTHLSMTFAIKTYPNGLISNHIFNKTITDTLYLSAPIIKQEYVPNKYRNVLMIAGGTGITPMLQILSEEDDTNYTLIYCNLTPNDIFLENELIKYKNLKVLHLIESIDGRISKYFIEQRVMVNNELMADYCYVCGPKQFMEVVCGGKEHSELKGYLKEIGFCKEQVYKF